MAENQSGLPCDNGQDEGHTEAHGCEKMEDESCNLEEYVCSSQNRHPSSPMEGVAMCTSRKGKYCFKRKREASTDCLDKMDSGNESKTNSKELYSTRNNPCELNQSFSKKSTLNEDQNSLLSALGEITQQNLHDKGQTILEKEKQNCATSTQMSSAHTEVKGLEVIQGRDKSIPDVVDFLKNTRSLSGSGDNACHDEQGDTNGEDFSKRQNLQNTPPGYPKPMGSDGDGPVCQNVNVSNCASNQGDSHVNMLKSVVKEFLPKTCPDNELPICRLNEPFADDETGECSVDSFICLGDEFQYQNKNTSHKTPSGVNDIVSNQGQTTLLKQEEVTRSKDDILMDRLSDAVYEQSRHLTNEAQNCQKERQFSTEVECSNLQEHRASCSKQTNESQNSSQHFSKMQVQSTDYSLSENKDVAAIGEDICYFCINDLPSNILLQVFQHFTLYELLRVAAPVCSLWRQLSRDPDLWRTIDLRGQPKYTDNELKQLSSYSDRVVYLNISDAKSITEEGLIEVLAYCDHLEFLKLSRCYTIVTEETLCAIGNHCRQLKVLHLQVCYKVKCGGLIALAEGCPELTELHLNQCQNVSDSGISAIGKHCHKLESLMLDNCTKVHDGGILEVVSGCPNLRILNLTSTGLTNNSVIEIQRLKKLEILDISGLPHITWHAVASIVQNCRMVRCLNISLNKELGDECLEQIALNCPNLKRLYCVSCSITDKGLEKLGRYSPCLEYLDVGWCSAVTAEGVRMMSEMCKTLRYIGLIRCDGVDLDVIDELMPLYPHVDFSTFVHESRKLIERALQAGFQFQSGGNSNSFLNVSPEKS